MILHIPHSNTKLLKDVNIPNIKDNINILTDWFIDDLFFNDCFNSIGTDIHIFEYSRFICDVERYLSNEPMEEKYGHGVLYKKDYFGNGIISNEKIDKIRLDLYEKHHGLLVDKINYLISYFPKVYIIDCHSFDENSLFLENNVNELPDICIGTTKENTNEKDVDNIRKIFESNNLSVNINYPFSGSIIPDYFIGSKNVNTIMIEVNKNLYLTKDYKKNDNFKKLSGIIYEVLKYIEEKEYEYIR